MNKKHSDDLPCLCTVVFDIKKGQADVGRFIYALACRVEKWQDIEVVSLKVGDQHYLSNPTEELNQGADHDQ